MTAASCLEVHPGDAIGLIPQLDIGQMGLIAFASCCHTKTFRTQH